MNERATMNEEEKYQLFTLTLPPLGVNCYILVDTATKKAAVIDPGGSVKPIMAQVEQAGAQVALIINTHGHWDHSWGNRELQQLTQAPLLIHEADADMLSDAGKSAAAHFGAPWQPSQADHLLKNGDEIDLGQLRLQVLHTPGHTPGGICLFCQDLCFAGDTLFKLSMGRTDLAGGDDEQMEYSLIKLMRYPDETKVLPGHGPATSIGYERKYNPYI